MESMKKEEIKNLLKRDCQKSKEAKCYSIKSNDKEGRYLVATRDIEAGELILQELPCFHSPGFSTKPVCLGCYKFVTNSQSACSQCGWPLCSKTCDLKTNHKAECDFFRRKNFKVDASKFVFDDIEPTYDVITPIRLLVMKETKPDSYGAFMQLESHVDQWKMDPGWKDGHGFIIDFIKNKLKIKITEEEILRIFGICYTNDFSVKVDGGFDESGNPKNCAKIRLCYALSSMCSHDCVPNTWRNILPAKDGFRHDIRARRKIFKGETLTISYEDIFLPTLVRRKELSYGKKFICECDRCNDPTELGSFLSALLCQRCGGSVLPVKTQFQIWKCTKCESFELSETEVESFFSELLKKTDQLLNDIAQCNVVSMEQFLSSHKDRLYPRNGFYMRIKYSLCGLYGRTPGFEVGNLSPKMLMRKQQLCQDVLNTLNQVDPGISARKGLVMYELHLPVAMLAQMSYYNGLLNDTAARKEFLSALTYLKNSLDHLQYEPEGTFEKSLYYGARESVEPLDTFIQSTFGEYEQEEE